MKVGFGYDIHRLVEERKLFLGGIEIPFVKGLIGYSDGDVLLHAIADAILGAAALGDIGQHFPDTDPRYKGIASREILKKVAAMVNDKGYDIYSIDTVVLAEEPKIYPFRESMVEAISGLLKIGKDAVNIKATTNEGVGAIGRGDAIAAHAVVTLKKR